MSDIDVRHFALVNRTCKDPDKIVATFGSDHAHLVHMAMGISGEAGELLDAIKKHVIYNKRLDVENIIEELGDLEWFLQGLRAVLNITREQTLEHNITKLLKRYPDAYTDEAAQARADKK